MSLWHAPQASESIKKFDGMMPPVLVCADEGANGEGAPAPSWSMEPGATSGFWMRSFGLGRVLWYSPALTGASSAARVMVTRATFQVGGRKARKMRTPMRADRKSV